VTVRGALSAGDLRRLERACGRALEEREMALELDLDVTAGVDEPARLYLDRLIRRGAVLC